MKKHLPNFITCLNLFAGCCAIVSLANGDFKNTILFFVIGGIADFMDGMVARWLNVSSPLGKELDSLADVVSFGVVPGMVFYTLLLIGQSGSDFSWHLNGAAIPAFLIPVFSALRLANFNLDTRQTEHFIGLNTPACTIFTMGLLLVYINNSFGWANKVTSPYLLYPVILLLCWLLVAELPLFSFKFKSLRWKGNEVRFLFSGVAVLLLILLREAALPAVIALYVLMGIVFPPAQNDKKRRH